MSSIEIKIPPAELRKRLCKKCKRELDAIIDRQIIKQVRPRLGLEEG